MAIEVTETELKIGDEVEVVGKLAGLFRDERGVIEQIEVVWANEVAVKYFVRFGLGHHRIPFLRSNLRKLQPHVSF